jgi:hypothetical protein
MEKELREDLAALSHQVWAHWMTYLFSVCEDDGNGRLVIPTEKHKRWRRQMATTYKDLPESEKESDREQADKYIDMIERWKWALNK